MSGFSPEGKLTAYQRWELAAFDEEEPKAIAVVEPVQEQAPAVEAESPVTLTTAADVERIHAEAHESGYAAGYAEGIARAGAEATQFGALLKDFEDSLGALEEGLADRLLAVALEIASQVLRQSLKVKPELLLPVVREAVAALRTHDGRPALFVHPDDAALIRQHLGEQLSHNNWRIFEDNQLVAGGCRVEIGASEVDATMETRWRRVVETLGADRDWLDGES